MTPNNSHINKFEAINNFFSFPHIITSILRIHFNTKDPNYFSKFDESPTTSLKPITFSTASRCFFSVVNWKKVDTDNRLLDLLPSIFFLYFARRILQVKSYNEAHQLNYYLKFKTHITHFYI